MSTPTVADFAKAKDSFRQALALPGPTTIVVEHHSRRRVAVDLTRDGVSSWCVRVRSGERVLMDSGVMGISLDQESLVEIVINGFRLLDLPVPATN